MSNIIKQNKIQIRNIENIIDDYSQYLSEDDIKLCEIYLILLEVDTICELKKIEFFKKEKKNGT